MEIYNQIIRSVAELTGKSAPQRYAYDPSRAWEDAGAFELIMAREAAFELGGDNLPAVNFSTGLISAQSGRALPLPG